MLKKQYRVKWSALTYPWWFLVVDTRNVETTIRMGQNMQVCINSLKWKQIDMSTADQLTSIKQRQMTLMTLSFESSAEHMHV